MADGDEIKPTSNDGTIAIALLVSFMGLLIVGGAFLWKNRRIFGIEDKRLLNILSLFYCRFYSKFCFNCMLK